jgi:hypothetical protein
MLIKPHMQLNELKSSVGFAPLLPLTVQRRTPMSLPEAS